MGTVKIVLNSDGVRQLLKSSGVQKLLKDKASEIRGRCGDGYEQDIHIGENRANAMIWAETPKAKHDNLQNNTILKAVHHD